MSPNGDRVAVDVNNPQQSHTPLVLEKNGSDWKIVLYGTQSAKGGPGCLGCREIQSLDSSQFQQFEP